MLYCIDCKVRITGNSDRCPLCDKHMPGAYQQNPEPKYPEYIPKVRSNRKLAKAMFISAILLIMLSAGINALTWSGSLWSVIFSAYVLYIWLMGLVTFKTRVHLGIKLVGHAISVSVLMLIMNVFISKTGTLNPVTWSVSYGMPIVFIAFIVAAVIIMIKKKQNRKDFLFYLLCLCVAGFVPFIIVLCFLTEPMLPGLIAAAISYLIIMGLAVFARKAIAEEFVKKFHV
ncbi:MAG: DUF6320 domain-containing protein [Clostridia bacterium]|jgi:hypothetical protein